MESKERLKPLLLPPLVLLLFPLLLSLRCKVAILHSFRRLDHHAALEGSEYFPLAVRQQERALISHDPASLFPPSIKRIEGSTRTRVTSEESVPAILPLKV